MLGLRQGREPMHIQTLRPQSSIERFHIGVVGRLPGPREVDLHLVLIGPQIHALTGELRSVVAEDEL